jgi:Uma2 family endonuclease
MVELLCVGDMAAPPVQFAGRQFGAVMTTLTEAVLTTEQLLAFPENDGIDRELINGQLRERPMTRRNRRHSRTESNFVKFIGIWNDTLPEPRGEVLCGEAGFRLRTKPDTTVGIDVAYISPKTAAANEDSVGLIDGVPILVVEILSPSDSQEDVLEKVQVYLDCGVALVWVAEPVFRAVTVYRPGAEPELFNAQHFLDGGSDLPGFRVKVADCF